MADGAASSPRYDVCVLTGDYRGQTFGPFEAAPESVARVSTPEQKCIGWPEQKYISDAGKKAPELGAFR
jgi:hypothetical protein